MNQSLLAIYITCFMLSVIAIGFLFIAYYIKQIYLNVNRQRIIKQNENVIDFCEYKRNKQKKLA